MAARRKITIMSSVIPIEMPNSIGRAKMIVKSCTAGLDARGQMDGLMLADGTGPIRAVAGTLTA